MPIAATTLTPEVPPLPDLTDTHELALALFKYGLAEGPDDLAIAMNISRQRATALCEELVAWGLLSPDGSD